MDLKPETIEQLKMLKTSGGLEEIKVLSREAIKNQCADRILGSKSDGMKEAAQELKNSVVAISWLFDVFIEKRITPKKDKKVDKNVKE